MHQGVQRRAVLAHSLREASFRKTTVLRDIARILGDTRRVAVVDTRGEIAGVYGGVPALDIGENTDVLNGYSRGEGIMCALRSLSPEVIICDEIAATRRRYVSA